MKLGVSFQYPEKLTPSHLDYLKHMGVEAIELRMLSDTYSFDELRRVQDKVQAAGLEIHELMLQDKYNLPAITLGRDGRDEEIEFLQGFLRDLGKAGIKHTTYAWHSGGAGMTGETTSRGARTRFFRQDAALAEPNKYERTYSDDDMWETYFYFMERILPVAEEADVRLQLHPNDPPLTHHGVARIFRDTASFRRAFEGVDHNPHSAILFCVGTFAEMPGDDGKGEDIVAAIREFGPTGHITQVHLRNTSSPIPNFQETFPDIGYLDLLEIVCALREVGFKGMITPDHILDCGDGRSTGTIGEAYALGYMRSLIQASETIVALRDS
jgi:mannonate dehydratase